jgi:hypothetical protein
MREVALAIFRYKYTRLFTYINEIAFVRLVLQHHKKETSKYKESFVWGHKF